VVICLEWGADLHIAQLMPLSLTICSPVNPDIGFTRMVMLLWCRLTQVVVEEWPLNECSSSSSSSSSSKDIASMQRVQFGSRSLSDRLTVLVIDR